MFFRAQSFRRGEMFKSPSDLYLARSSLALGMLGYLLALCWYGAAGGCEINVPPQGRSP